MTDKIQVIDYISSLDLPNTEKKRFKVQFHSEGEWKFLGLYADTDLMTIAEAKAFIKDAQAFSPETLYQIRRHVERKVTKEEKAFTRDMQLITAAYPLWTKISESTYNECLGAVPPIYFQGGWAMGEAQRYNTAENASEYTCFTHSKGKFWACLNTIKKAVATCP